MANHEQGLEEAKESVNELRQSIEKVIAALDELEGSICDTDSLDNVALVWGGRESQPCIHSMLDSISLISAKFNYEFEENL